MNSQLKDIQNQGDKRGIDIQKVGVNGVEVPLIIERKNEESQVVSFNIGSLSYQRLAP